MQLPTEGLTKRPSEQFSKTSVSSTAKLVKAMPGLEITFFVNPVSGGCRASVYLPLAAETTHVVTTNGTKAIVHVCNVRDDEQKEKAYARILSQHPEEHIALIMGGDGTLHYIVEEMAERKIDLGAVVFALLPFGTGNDLARVLGWGGRTRRPMERGDVQWIVE